MLKTIRYERIAVLAMACVLAGCPTKTDRRPEPSGSVVAWAEYPSLVNPSIGADDAIATVDGHAITRGEFDRWDAIRCIVYALHNKLDATKRNKKTAKYRNGTRDAALADLIRRELIRQASERESFSPSVEDVMSAQKAFMRGILKPNDSFDGFCETLPGGLEGTLRELVLSDARCEAYLMHWATNDFTRVSSAEVSNRIAYVEKYEADIVRMNDEAKQKAKSAKAEILAGASFASVVTNRAELYKDQGTYWDTVDLTEFEPDEPIFRFLASAKTGDISDPLDFEDGIGIVGVVLRETPEATSDDESPVDQFTLVRCMFNGYESLDEPTDFAAMRKLLVERQTAAAREALIESLTAKAKVAMPYGRKLFAVKRKPPQKARRAKRKKGRQKVKSDKTDEESKELEGGKQ